VHTRLVLGVPCFSWMTEAIILMPGQGESDRPELHLAGLDLEMLHSVAAEFGWQIGIVGNLREAAARQACDKTVAAILHGGDLNKRCSWPDACRRLKPALPGVRVIACHGIAEPIDSPTLSAAGIFHTLAFPLKENEVRQSFGFVWEAEERLANSGRNFPNIVIPRLRPDIIQAPGTIQPKPPSRSRPSRTSFVRSAGG
jgi:hypothetical protein